MADRLYFLGPDVALFYRQETLTDCQVNRAPVQEVAELLGTVLDPVNQEAQVVLEL